MNQLAFLTLAAALVFIGIWAHRDAPALVSLHLETRARAKRERVIRRGAMACYGVAAAFAAFAASDLFMS